jgi:glyoxalase family protein
MKTPLITGIHHVTSMVVNPNRNLKTYTRDLGMRLVKVTVNYDAPDVYHFYMGNAIGEPGSAITFFPFHEMHKGQLGSGQLTYTAYSVSSNSLPYWQDRLGALGYTLEPLFTRFGDQVLRFYDHDGLGNELVANAKDTRIAWDKNGVPVSYGIKGFSSVTLDSRRPDQTKELLLHIMEHRLVGTEGSISRYESGAGGHGTYIDVISTEERGHPGAGTVHHLAFRTPDDLTQAAFINRLAEFTGYRTDVKDRQYFHSIYFREAGGILFEVATDTPGFMTDEDFDSLGTALRLPNWLEPQREAIISRLEKIEELKS